MLNKPILNDFDYCTNTKELLDTSRWLLTIGPEWLTEADEALLLEFSEISVALALLTQRDGATRSYRRFLVTA
jgi:hypothetical protein